MPPVVAGELVAAITHDLRQPLTAVEMNVSAAIVFLQRSAPQIDEAIDALTDALGQQRRMRDALQVLQHLAMHRAPTRESVDLGALMREVVDLVSADALARHVPVELDLEADSPAISGDVVLVRQALLNILLGAVEATSLGGAQGPVRVAVRGASTGARPPESRVPRVVAPRRDTAGAEVEVTHFGERGAGAGPEDWGLALARSVISAHGATIAFGGDPASGLTVVTRWPTQPPEATTPASLPDAR